MKKYLAGIAIGILFLYSVFATIMLYEYSRQNTELLGENEISSTLSAEDTKDPNFTWANTLQCQLVMDYFDGNERREINYTLTDLGTNLASGDWGDSISTYTIPVNTDKYVVLATYSSGTSELIVINKSTGEVAQSRNDLDQKYLANGKGYCQSLPEEVTLASPSPVSNKYTAEWEDPQKPTATEFVDSMWQAECDKNPSLEGCEEYKGL